jgi:hypothetical protein
MWGGFSLLVSGVIALLFFLLVIVSGQTLPVPAVEVFENPFRPSALFSLTVIGEVLLLPSVLGLYFALKNINKTKMIMATALWALCVPMFLASRGQIFAISQLSDNYSHTTNELLKVGYLASAELALEVQNLYAMMGLTLLSIASIIIGSVILTVKEEFGRNIGYIAITAGFFTIFGAISFIMDLPVILPVIGVILSAIWQSIVGFRLYKLGQKGGV